MARKRPSVRIAACVLAACAAAAVAAMFLFDNSASAPKPASGASGAPADAERPRIVSFVPSATETAFAVGLGPLLVGRSRFCDFPPESAALEAVGDLMTLSEEAVARLRPTHALLYSATSPGQTPFLAAAGAEIVECGATDVASVVAVADELGRRFPAFTNGFAAGPWRAAMEALASAPPAPPGAPSALVAVSHPEAPWSDVFAAGGDTFYEQLLRAAGYSNVLSEARGYPVLTPEKVRALAPDVVFDLKPGSDPDPEGEAAFWRGPVPGARLLTIRDQAAVRPGPRLPDVAAAFAGR